MLLFGQIFPDIDKYRFLGESEHIISHFLSHFSIFVGGFFVCNIGSGILMGQFLSIVHFIDI